MLKKKISLANMLCQVLHIGFSHDIMSEWNSFLYFLHLITLLLVAAGGISLI